MITPNKDRNYHKKNPFFSFGGSIQNFKRANPISRGSPLESCGTVPNPVCPVPWDKRDSGPFENFRDETNETGQ